MLAIDLRPDRFGARSFELSARPAFFCLSLRSEILELGDRETCSFRDHR
jgi:hypothetical protein